MLTQPLAAITGTLIPGYEIEGTNVYIGRFTDGPFVGMYDLTVRVTEDERVRVVITRETMWTLVSDMLEKDADMRAAVPPR